MRFDPFHAPRTRLLFLLIAVTVLLGVSGSRTPLPGMLRAVATSALEPFRSLAAGWNRNDENDALKRRIYEMQKALVKLSTELAVTREKLREAAELSHLEEASRWKPVAADIIGADASTVTRTVVIDVGYEEGILAGYGVTSRGRVFGVVSEVYRWSARVTPLSSPGWSISGFIPDMNARGVIRNRRGGKCVMEYVVTGRRIPAGKIVVTSGTDGVFPRGILVGKVSAFRWVQQGLVAELTVEPAVTPSMALHVFVLKPRKET